MNSNILQNIKQYLESHTNNAILITGEWGSGKTYFFHEVLKREIEKTKCFNNPQKNYKPILISLFGINSIDEIKKEIALSLFPALKNSKLKTGAAIGKTIVQGLLNLKGLGFVTEFFKEVKIDLDLIINTEEIVLCFDDLERMSRDLDFDEVVGFINSLVENDNNKVLIIANENKILDKDKSYKELKEKVIGNTLEYMPDLKDRFEDIINKYFPEQNYLHSFLIEKKDFIVEFFSKKSKNIRILIFSLKIFQEIFNKIFELVKKDKVLCQYEDEILLNILRFTLAISIEFKNGNLSYSKRMDLDSEIPDLYWAAINKSNSLSKERSKSDRDIFLEDYYIKGGFKFYGSIYDYVTGAKIFETSILFDELKTFFKYEKDLMPEHIQILNSLNYSNCFNLEDDEYIQKTEALIEYAYEGKFELNTYWLIFHYSMRFGNMLNLNPDELVNKLLDGIEKCVITQKYYSNLEFELSNSEDSEDQVYINKINERAIKVNVELLNKKEESEFKELENLFYQNYDDFVKKVFSYDSPYFSKPIFSHFDVSLIVNCIKTCDANKRHQLLQKFRERYNSELNYLKKEHEFLKNILLELNRAIFNSESKSLKKYILTQFAELFKNTIKKIESLQ